METRGQPEFVDGPECPCYNMRTGWRAIQSALQIGFCIGGLKLPDLVPMPTAPVAKLFNPDARSVRHEGWAVVVQVVC